ncbi:hypothetical protein PROFUN_17031, partial [Planoprotostelium fungivorum]
IAKKSQEDSKWLQKKVQQTILCALCFPRDCLKYRIQDTKIRGKKCDLNEESENLKGLFETNNIQQQETINMCLADINSFTERLRGYLQQSASQYDYSFLPDTWFFKSVSAVAQICSKTNAVLPVVLESYPFYFKIELNCTLVNIEDGTTIDKSYLFPADHAIKISSIKHISDLNNTLQLWIQNSFAADDSVPDTKHRVHEFIAFKLKLAKSQQVDAGLKNKRCLKNPDLKDNLCFWRSITIALYESSYKCKKIETVARLVFKDKPIQSSTSLYKQSFGTELVRPLFLAYDFECILKKMNNNEGFEYEYCGPDAGRHFVDHLNSIHDSLTDLLKTHFWKHHNKQMAVIETQKCSCQYTLHRSWCCKYIVTKCLIMKEYLSIPILGYNSGKYDLTFIITCMQKYDISPPITKTNSYMKLEYGAYAFPLLQT